MTHPDKFNFDHEKLFSQTLSQKRKKLKNQLSINISLKPSDQLNNG